MPAVVPFATGFTAGVVAGLLLSAAPWLIAPVSAAGSLLFWRRVPAIAVTLAAAAAGVLWGGGARRAAMADCAAMWKDGVRLALVVEPLDLAESGRPVLAEVRSPRCNAPVRVVMPPDAEAKRIAGPAVFLVHGTWRRDDGGKLGSGRGGLLVARRAIPLSRRAGFRARLRVGAEARLAHLFGKERAPLVSALTVSANAQVPRDVRERYARSGLAHLLSISGFHVAILAGALAVLLRASRLSTNASLLSGTFLVGAYVWMLGFPAPAVRSAVMLGLMAWGRLRERPAHPAALLGSTVLLVLAVGPESVLAAGTWLSFAGVWGCTAADALWRDAALKRWAVAESPWRALLHPLIVSLGASLATAPVSVLAFGTMTPAAVVANLAAVPLGAVAVPSIALALLLDVAGLGGAAQLAAAASGVSLGLLDRVAEVAGSLPLSEVSFAVQTTAAASLAVVAWVVLRPLPHRVAAGPPKGSWMSAKRARPPAPAILKRLATGAALGAAFAAWLPVAATWASPHGAGLLEIHFLSVGQGDAAAIKTPAGRWVLIDGGPRVPGFDAGARRVVPFLRRHGVRRLSVVVASHGDADHLGGLPAVLEAIPTDAVLEPGEALVRPLYRTFLSGVTRGGSRWLAGRAGASFTIDGVSFRVWHPDSAWMERREEANENSVVLSVEYSRFRALFPGDAGLPMEVERARDIGDVSLLKVGHHGSRTSTGTTWIEAVRPEICVVSVGRNTYGHPSPVTLASLKAAECSLWRTDLDGDVTVTTDGHTATMRGGRRDATFELNGNDGERR